MNNMPVTRENMALEAINATAALTVLAEKQVTQNSAIENATRPIFSNKALSAPPQLRGSLLAANSKSVKSYKEMLEEKFLKLEQQLINSDHKQKSELVRSFQKKYPKYMPLYTKWFFYLFDLDPKNIEPSIHYIFQMQNWMGTFAHLKLTLACLYLISGTRERVQKALSLLNDLVSKPATENGIPFSVWFEVIRIAAKCIHVSPALLIRCYEQEESNNLPNSWIMNYKISFLIANRFYTINDVENAFWWFKQVFSHIPEGATIMDSDAPSVINFYSVFYNEDQQFYTTFISKLPHTEPVIALLSCLDGSYSGTTYHPIAQGLFRLKTRMLNDLKDLHEQILRLPPSFLRWKFLLLHSAITGDKETFKKHESEILTRSVQAIPHLLQTVRRMYAIWQVKDDAVDIALKAAKKYPFNSSVLDAVVKITCKSSRPEKPASEIKERSFIVTCAERLLDQDPYHPEAHFILGLLDKNAASSKEHFMYAVRSNILTVHTLAMSKAFSSSKSQAPFLKPLSREALAWKKSLKILPPELREHQEQAIAKFPVDEIPFIFSNFVAWYKRWNREDEICRVAHFLANQFPQNPAILESVLQFLIGEKKINLLDKNNPNTLLALNCANTVLAYDPENCESNLVIGEFYLTETNAAKGSYEKALHHYLYGFQNDLYRDTVELGFLSCATSIRKNEKASLALLASLRKILQKFFHCNDIRIALGRALITNSQIFEAEEVLRPLLFEEKNFEVNFILASGYPFDLIEKKKFYTIEALRAAKFSNSLPEEIALLHFLAAKILLKEKRIALAEKHLELAIQVPSASSPRIVLIELLLRQTLSQENKESSDVNSTIQKTAPLAKNVDYARVLKLFLEIKRFSQFKNRDKLFSQILKVLFTRRAYEEIVQFCAAYGDDFSQLPYTAQVMYCFSLCVLGKSKQVYESIPMSCCIAANGVREFFDLMKEALDSANVLPTEVSTKKYLLYAKSKNL